MDPYIQEMLLDSVIEEVKEKDLHSILYTFLVPKKDSDKDRFVVDCRPLNYHLDPPYVRIDGVRELKSIWNPRLKWAVKVDLSTAYWHNWLHPDHRKFFGMRWGDRFFHWKVMPYGISTALWMFISLAADVLFSRKLSSLQTSRL